MAMINGLQWQGTDQTYRVPWRNKRIEFSADPARIRRYAQTNFTRSQITRDLLTRFHLSNHSIVVSDDEHAEFLRGELRGHLRLGDRFESIARGPRG